MRTITIAHDILDQMKRHALHDFPYECVGFFYGDLEKDQRLVKEYRPVANSDTTNKKRKFEVSPLDYIQAERHALRHNVQLLGVYHSHPLHPAVPSVHDLQQAVPVFSYIISSVNESEVESVTSWWLNEDENRFEEEILILN